MIFPQGIYFRIYCSSISLITCSGARMWLMYPDFSAPLSAFGLVLAEQIPTAYLVFARSSRGIWIA